ncbi:hypothetical protein J2Y66_001525 [Paenarthrobacter nitroguajacolicus]|uniref:hypothetical protein n=1 Tax=Paenarthrobacter TaxID=1742992 RepID=UPI00285F5731|nr:hypothetical protein [Paenarthrobacter nitroguajacolicus]MDR6987043.1 hypothetical protein [Paenarthrobacter nitroguajacolicus]
MVVMVAATAGSTVAPAWAPMEGAGVVPGWVEEAGVAVQPVIVTVAATTSDNAAARSVADLADVPFAGVVPLLIT